MSKRAQDLPKCHSVLELCKHDCGRRTAVRSSLKPSQAFCTRAALPPPPTPSNLTNRRSKLWEQTKGLALGTPPVYCLHHAPPIQSTQDLQPHTYRHAQLREPAYTDAKDLSPSAYARHRMIIHRTLIIRIPSYDCTRGHLGIRNKPLRASFALHVIPTKPSHATANCEAGASLRRQQNTRKA